MAPATKNKNLKYGLLLLWVTMVLLEITVPVQSQGCGPPLVTPGYMNPITITQGSWRPAIGNVAVKIDANFATFTPDASFLIEEGQRKWNSPLTCAAVSFTNFQDVDFTSQDLLSPAPFGEVHWEVDTPSNVLAPRLLVTSASVEGLKRRQLKLHPTLWSVIRCISTISALTRLVTLSI